MCIRQRRTVESTGVHLINRAAETGVQVESNLNEAASWSPTGVQIGRRVSLVFSVTVVCKLLI